MGACEPPRCRWHSFSRHRRHCRRACGPMVSSAGQGKGGGQKKRSSRPHEATSVLIQSHMPCVVFFFLSFFLLQVWQDANPKYKKDGGRMRWRRCIAAALCLRHGTWLDEKQPSHACPRRRTDSLPRARALARLSVGAWTLAPLDGTSWQLLPRSEARWRVSPRRSTTSSCPSLPSQAFWRAHDSPFLTMQCKAARNCIVCSFRVGRRGGRWWGEARKPVQRMPC